MRIKGGSILEKNKKYWDIKNSQTDLDVIESFLTECPKESVNTFHYLVFLKKIFYLFCSSSFFVILLISFLVLWSSKTSLTQKVYAGFNNSKLEFSSFSFKNFDPQDIIEKLDKIENNLKNSEKTLTTFGQTGSYFEHFEIVGKDLGAPQRVAEIAKNTRILSNKLKFFLEENNFKNLSLTGIQKEIKEILILGHKINQDLLVLQDTHLVNNELFSELSLDLNNIEQYLDQLEKLATFTPEILGFNQNQRYLLLFQNNREARPTGGFIGNYGILNIKDGKIEKPYIQDSYYLGFLKRTLYKNDSTASIKNYPKELKPPDYIKNEVFNGEWIWDLLDRNWSVDFPISAKSTEYALNEIYHQGSADGVIALDTNLIVDILKILGPIKVLSENQIVELNSQNFVDIIEYKVEIDNEHLKGDKSANRKQILVDFADILLQRLNNLDLKTYLQISRVIFKNFQTKNIQLYFNNPRLEALVKDLGFAGELKNINQDYLYINRANISNIQGGKGSQSILNKINYLVSIDAQHQQATSSLKIFAQHQGSKTDFDKSVKTFWQILTPRESALLKSEINHKNNFLVTKNYEYFERNIFVQQTRLNTRESQNLELEYQLPFKIKTDLSGKGQYELLVQKQPGIDTDEYEIKIQFPVGWKIQPSKNYIIQDNSVIWQGKLLQDLDLKVNFEKTQNPS